MIDFVVAGFIGGITYWLATVGFDVWVRRRRDRGAQAFLDQLLTADPDAQWKETTPPNPLDTCLMPGCERPARTFCSEHEQASLY